MTKASSPERIGHYSILGELGRGAMGIVYLARDPRLGREIALKVLPDALARDSDALSRFELEARCLATLNHANIATIHSLEEADGVRFLTMERIRGRSLHETLAAGRLPIDDVLAIGRQLARALEAAHKNGVVHRDLKPENVMLTGEGEVKVLDFGLARTQRLSAISPDTSTLVQFRRGTIEGTPGYMSPEQAQGDPVDHRADIWSYGCVLYECLTGRPAFGRRPAVDLLIATLHETPDLDAVPSDTPNFMTGILRGCFARDPAERISSMSDVRRAFEEEIVRRSRPESGPQRPADTTLRHNLPLQLTRFIGRDRELAEARRLVGEQRLVTLIGPGGSGKTRLALETAGTVLPDFPDGVWLIELASVGDPARVQGFLATTLAIKDRAGQSLPETLVEELRPRKLLLVLDNCEHVLAACAELAGLLLRSCPGLRILATSREGLRITGEVLLLVPPLSLPAGDGRPSLAELRGFSAVQLFLERAAAMRPGFTLTDANADAVLQICRRLDGLPLALELAAARIRMLDVHEIARRLDDRFRLLTLGSRTTMRHHQTLQALIDWSYDQLCDAERALLRRLSVFSGGWTFADAEAVASGDGLEEWDVLDHLSRLVDRSLVEIDPDTPLTSPVRYRMLETVRQYARNRLDEAGETERCRSRFRDRFLAVAEEAERLLSGPEQQAWFSRLDAEHANLRDALDICVASDVEAGLRLAGALGRYWMVRGHWSEGRATYDVLLAAPARGGVRTAARAKALKWAGSLANTQGDYDEARTHQEESLAIQREIGDRAGIAASLASLGALAANQGDYARAEELHEESLSLRRELGDRHGIADALKNLGVVARNEHRLDDARRAFEESLAILRELGDRRGTAVLLYYLGEVAIRQNDVEEARAFFGEGLPIFREMNDRRLVAFLLNGLGSSSRKVGDLDRARAYLEMGLAVRYGLDDRAGVEESLEEFAGLEAAAGDMWRAARLAGAAEALLAEMSVPCSEELAETTRAARGALGEAAFQRESDAGRAMELEAVVAHALRIEETG